tara:strand:+ start:361 stop:552 length:192 start_codon:yes stop_codon:yes gene_type:complete
MSNGFDVEFDLPKSELKQLIKKYKKINKYRKSSLFAVKTMDNTEELVSKLIAEYEKNPIEPME